MQVSLFSPIIERALRVASVKHLDQRRKGADLPYITHLAGVALILQRAGFADDSLIAAAILHDVVEDTDCTVEELTRDFPTFIVDAVRETSEQKLSTDGVKLPWRTRKEEHLRRVALASLDARAIVLADKLHNLGTMLYDVESGLNVFGFFNAPPDEVMWYQRAMVTAAAGNDAGLQALAAECRVFIAKLEDHLKRVPQEVTPAT